MYCRCMGCYGEKISTNQCYHFCPRQSFYDSPIIVVNACVLFISSMQDVPHQTSASGAEYAVSSKAAAHQHDDVKDKKQQGVRIYATVCIDPLLYLHKYTKIRNFLLKWGP